MKIAEGHLVVSYVSKREAKVKSVTLFICLLKDSLSLYSQYIVFGGQSL